MKWKSLPGIRIPRCYGSNLDPKWTFPSTPLGPISSKTTHHETSLCSADGKSWIAATWTTNSGPISSLPLLKIIISNRIHRSDIRAVLTDITHLRIEPDIYHSNILTGPISTSSLPDVIRIAIILQNFTHNLPSSEYLNVLRTVVNQFFAYHVNLDGIEYRKLEGEKRFVYW